ncbi:short-chain dehydrogenase, partial [Stenotrophomonas rhizophila]
MASALTRADAVRMTINDTLSFVGQVALVTGAA